jgi:hypothetical protein
VHYTIYRKAVHRAAEIAGGLHLLAEKIDVPTEVLLHWLEDRGQPDERSFLRAVEIIMEADNNVPWTPAELDAELRSRTRP